ncbi:hypothetical protein [Bdellovibrio sp. HCB288]|uniref:hypothetical protein n=1 Tax=Bdellovibrio sp. HCB288 TaxID=3394355 RepID=UPI0039B626BF
MKLMSKFLILSFASCFAFSAQAARGTDGIEGVLEIPVHAGKVEMTEYSKLAGGIHLRLDPTGALGLHLKCHSGFGKTTLMVFFKGNLLSSQLTGSVDSMESCAQTLNTVAEAVQAGATVVRFEVHNNQTLKITTNN